MVKQALCSVRLHSLFFLFTAVVGITATDEALNSTLGHDDDEEMEAHHAEPEHAHLFPSFAVGVGLIVFYFITRFAKKLPYTAVLFFIGVLMGMGTVLNGSWDDVLNTSLRQWSGINSRVLLLVFLPGLIYKDAFGQEVHIFVIALGQCLIFAFPLVLAGTVLTALLAYYGFPYGWSFDLAMTFGAILSATDPVAVAALLEQVGAPPRLKVHIAGEALLNDGAAIVFFDIFVERFLGVEIGWGEGIKLFCQKAFGAVALGLFFAACLLLALYALDRKFSREENIVQVSATITFAYLGYYISEVVFATSGVLATVTMGVTVKMFGRSTFHDTKLLEDFWGLLEHLLNTVLFTLGGVVWGAVITDGEIKRSFVGRDWGYLILLYLFLHALRLLLFTIVYPLTSRIGLKTNWNETVFQVYGGLRGAVGIALGLFLDSEVRETSGDESEASRQTSKLFGFVGGIAFLTLCVNGVTAGPLLKYLRLADSSKAREKIVDAYHTRYVKFLTEKMVQLLSQPRFKSVNFAFVKHHVPDLAGLTRTRLLEAVQRHRDTSAPEEYSAPYLKRVIPYLEEDPDVQGDLAVCLNQFSAEAEPEDFDPRIHFKKVQRAVRTAARMRRRTLSTMRVMMEEVVDPLSLQELRLLFISILRAAYDQQVLDGELLDREFLTVALEASLDFAEDAVQNGEQIRDWDFLHLVDSRSRKISRFSGAARMIGCAYDFLFRRSSLSPEDTVIRLRVERSLAFMAAHRKAQQFLQSEFSDGVDLELSEVGKQVLSESQHQYEEAKKVLQQYPATSLEPVVSHKFCLILLNSGANYLTKLRERGLLKESEAEHHVHGIAKAIQQVLSCDAGEHPGECSLQQEEASLSEMLRKDEEMAEESTLDKGSASISALKIEVE